MYCSFDGSIESNKIFNFALFENSVDNRIDSVSKMFQLDVSNSNNELDNNNRN